MNNNKIIGTRIALLRSEHGITQDQLSRLVSERSTRKVPRSESVVSSWETGRKRPSEENMNILSDIFSVPKDYIRGIIDKDGNPCGPIQDDTDKNYQIENENILHFDGKPVFITFTHENYEDQWGIVNSEKNAIILKNGILVLKSNLACSFYVKEPDYHQFLSESRKKPLDMIDLMHPSREKVWVEMITSNRYIQGLYNGWFSHNENRTALINATGLVLPYEGLNVSYYACSRKYF